MTRLFPLLSLFLFTACVTVKPECRTHGGAQWRELSSQHYLVRTNLEPEVAQATVAFLERARAALVLALPGTPGAEAHLEVVVFRSGAELAGAWGDAASTNSLANDWGGSFLVLSDPTSFFDGTAAQQRLVHDLAHHLEAHTLQRWPRWVGEGLASYFEPLAIDGKAQSARRGRAHQQRLADIERWGLLPLASLWQWDAEFRQKQSLDEHRLASAWFWVHFLFNTQRSAMTRFLHALSEGVEPRAAWAKHFSEVAPEALTKAADEYLSKRESRTQLVDLTKVSVEAKTRDLPDAEVHALLARLAAASNQWERARAEADAAMALDASSPRAVEQYVITRESTEARIAAAKQVTESHPELPSGWLLLGLSLPPDDHARSAALEWALGLDKNLALAGSELALLQCASGSCQEAVTLAQRAAEQEPTDLRIVSAWATVLARAGMCTKAIAAQERALEVLPDFAPDARLKQLRERLAELKQCGARPVATH